MNGFNWGLPENISATGSQIDLMVGTLHWFMLALFVFWGGFFVMCLVKFRARAGHKATYAPIHATWSKYLEIGVAIFEAVILIGFSMPVWASFKHGFPEEKDSTRVRIVAQQFAWNFWYPGPDGKFANSAPEFISSDNPVGIDPGDPNGKDDIVTINNLHFPVDKPVYAWISSKDVIHSFGVPSLRIRQDAIPGMSIPIWFKTDSSLVATARKEAAAEMVITQKQLDAANQLLETATKAGGKGTDEQVAVNQISKHLDSLTERSLGGFDIACSQLCGVSHGNMRAVLKAETPEEFKKWYDEQVAANLPPPTPEPTATPAPAASPAPTGKPAATPAATAKPATTATAAPAPTH